MLRLAVPPIRSVFPDYGPYTDFFEEIGPYLVRIWSEKSVFVLRLLWLVKFATWEELK